MKNYILKITALVLFTGTMVSCDEDKIVYDVDNGQSLVGFVEANADVLAMPPADGENIYEIEVGATDRVNYDRVVTLSINEESTTALPSEYTIDAPETWVIPAGQFTTKIKIKTNYDAIGSNERQLVFDLVSVQDQDLVDPFKTRLALTLYKYCPKAVATEYVGTITTQGVSGASYVVKPLATGALNEYTVTNMWGDFVFYATGGTNQDYKGKYPYAGSFRIKCDNSVIVTGTSSYALGGTGSYDEATQIINLDVITSLFGGTDEANVQFAPKE
jgi:hypothetical protein